MFTYDASYIPALEQALATALHHQSCLESDDPASIHREHARQVASCQRKLNKARKAVQS